MTLAYTLLNLLPAPLTPLSILVSSDPQTPQKPTKTANTTDRAVSQHLLGWKLNSRGQALVGSPLPGGRLCNALSCHAACPWKVSAQVSPFFSGSRCYWLGLSLQPCLTHPCTKSPFPNITTLKDKASVGEFGECGNWHDLIQDMSLNESLPLFSKTVIS